MRVRIAELVLIFALLSNLLSNMPVSRACELIDRGISESDALYPGAVLILDWSEEGIATIAVTERGDEGAVWLASLSLGEERVVSTVRMSVPGGVGRQASILRRGDSAATLIVTARGGNGLNVLDTGNEIVQECRAVNVTGIRVIPDYQALAGAEKEMLAFTASTNLGLRCLFVLGGKGQEIRRFMLPSELDLHFVWMLGDLDDVEVYGLASKAITADGLLDVVYLASKDRSESLHETGSWRADGYREYRIVGVGSNASESDVLIVGEGFTGKFVAGLHAANGDKKWGRKGSSAEGCAVPGFLSDGILYCGLPEANVDLGDGRWLIGGGLVYSIGLDTGQLSIVGEGQRTFDHFGATMDVAKRGDERLLLVGGDRSRLGEDGDLWCIHIVKGRPSAFSISLSALAAAR